VALRQLNLPPLPLEWTHQGPLLEAIPKNMLKRPTRLCPPIDRATLFGQPFACIPGPRAT
jgi:hypothetical protein